MYIISVPIMAVMSILFCKALQPVLDIIISNDKSKFLFYSILAIIFACLDMIASGFCKTMREKVRAEFLIEIKKNVFSGILKENIAEFNRKGSAYYMTILSRDVYQLCASYFDSICGIYRVIICFSVTFLTLMFVSPYIALLNLGVGFLSVVLPRTFEKKLNKAQNDASVAAEDYIKELKDSLSGFSTINLFHIQSRIKEKMVLTNTRQEMSTYKSNVLNYWVAWISMICSSLSYVLTIVIGTWLVLESRMTAGTVLMISQLIGGIVSPFEELPMYIAELKSVQDLKKKIESVIVKESKEHQTENLSIKKYALKLEDLSFSYEGEENQLSSLNLTFEEGKKYVIIGESGSGKSTLAKVLMGFYQNHTGQVLLDGRRLEEYPKKQLYSVMSYMQQEVFLFSDTLYNNITLYQEYDDSQVEKVIKLAGLEEVIGSLENGLQTVIKENGDNFSGGECQRIGLARALLTGAKYLVFDEVTASLDAVMENKIENSILGLDGIGSIIITHRLNPNLLEKCDEIIVLKDGTVVEKGGFEELMKKKEYFYGFYVINHIA